jgi:hypothetical protein
MHEKGVFATLQSQTKAIGHGAVHTNGGSHDACDAERKKPSALPKIKKKKESNATDSR